VGPALTLIGTITAAATLLQAGNGLLQALLPLRMQADGVSITGIGAVAGAYGFGFATGCLLAPAFIRHVGHIRAYASLAATVAVVALIFSQAHTILEWIVLRALTGITLAGLFTVTDGWIGARATSSHRGRILSIYMVCTKIALMLSPLGIGLGSIQGDGLFMVVSAVMCLSLLPVSATMTDEPPAPRTARVDVLGLFSVAPSAVVASFGVGLVNGPVLAIAPVYGVSVGLNQDQAATLLVALQGGSLILQWPLGWLSDQWDRRYVIASLAAGTGIVSLLILWASAGVSPAWIILAFAAWGGMALCIYSVCVAHACDLVEPDRIVPAISSLLVSWAVGVTIGPLPGAAMMDWLGPGGLFVYSAGVSFGLAAFILVRISLQRRPARKGGFVDLSPMSPASGALSPRARSDPPEAEAPARADEERSPV
jgi:MFS family permease